MKLFYTVESRFQVLLVAVGARSTFYARIAVDFSNDLLQPARHSLEDKNLQAGQAVHNIRNVRPRGQ